MSVWLQPFYTDLSVGRQVHPQFFGKIRQYEIGCYRDRKVPDLHALPVYTHAAHLFVFFGHNWYNSPQ